MMEGKVFPKDLVITVLVQFLKVSIASVEFNVEITVNLMLGDNHSDCILYCNKLIA